MTIAVDLGRKATKQTNKQKVQVGLSKQVMERNIYKVILKILRI